MRRVFLILSFLLVLSTCKKEDDPTVVVNASVADSSMGSIDFKAGSYAVGAAVTFSATPQTGYTFVSWTDSSTNQTYSNNPLTLNPDQNTTLVANFEKTAYEINVNVTGEGQVQKQVVGGGSSFTHGATVELTAVPADQYSFFYWDNDPSDTTNPKSITLDGNKDFSAKFDYEVAKNLVGDWEFEIGGDSSSRNVTVIRMSVDIRLNVLMTTIVNGVMISQVFSQIIPISTTAIVIGDFAVMTNVVLASPTSLSMSMVTLPENTPAPTKESEIPDNATPLNLSGKKSEEAPQKDESGIIIPPTEATTSSSTTEDIGSVFADSINQITQTQSSTVASETGSITSTLSGQSFLDRVNGKMFSSVKNESTAVFTFTNDLQGEFVKFSMIYDDCSETLINGSNIGQITKNTENELWFTFSIDPQNSDSARGETLHTAKLSFEDRSGTSSDLDNNDMILNVDIAFNNDGSELKAVSLSINLVSVGARDNLNLQISSNICNATIIDGESISGGNRRIEQNVCLGENIQSYNLQFNKLRGFDSLINVSEGNPNLAPLPRLLPVQITLMDGSVITSQNAGTHSNYYGIEYKCNVDDSAINSDNDGQDCDISIPVWGGSGILSYLYTGVITDTTVSSVHHTIQYGEDIISFITRVKPESECNSPTAGTNTSTTGTATPSGGGGGNTGTTSSTGGGGNNSGTTSTSSSNFCTNHTGKIWQENNNMQISSSYIMFLENTLTTGENIAIEYELTNNQNDQCDIKKIGDNFEEISNGCSINAFIEIVENSSNYFRIKLTEIYCNNSVPPSIGYMSFSVNNNIMTRTYEKNGVIEESSTYNIFTGNLNTNCFDLSSTTGTTTTTTGTTTSTTGTTTPTDTTPPIITLNGQSSITLSVGDTYSEAGATANDNIDGNLTNNIVITGSVDTSSPGTYTVTYTVNDASNNTSSIARTITINQDTPPPVITLNGESFITLIVGDTYSEAGAVAFTYLGEDITNNLVITGSVDTSSPGIYTVTYTVSDASNNTSSIARTITVQASTANTSQAFTINVSANNASNYILNGTDRNGQVSGNDPTVTIKVGDTVNFAVNASGHPFYLKTVQGTGTANTISGVTNNGTTNGTVSWTPTQAGTYYYICSLHGGMVGTIIVN